MIAALRKDVILDLSLFEVGEFPGDSVRRLTDHASADWVHLVILRMETLFVGIAAPRTLAKSGLDAEISGENPALWDRFRAVTIARNQWSRSAGTGGHDRAEYAIERYQYLNAEGKLVTEEYRSTAAG